MNAKALHKLEFNKIIDRLTEHAASQSGKDLCRHLTPSDDLSQIRLLQSQTADAFSRILKKGSPSFGGIKDVRGSLKRLEIGSSLNAIELLAVCTLLETAARAKSYGRKDNADLTRDSLDDYFDGLIQMCIRDSRYPPLLTGSAVHPGTAPPCNSSWHRWKRQRWPPGINYRLFLLPAGSGSETKSAWR